MSDLISGVVQKAFQQTLQDQTAKPQTETTGKRSFESYLQQNGGTENGGVTQSQAAEPQKISGADMQSKLDQMQADLQQKFNQNQPANNNFNAMIPELSDGKSRLGLLKEAYNNIGNTSKATGNLSGRFTQIESEYKNVEQIMKSDKNLSPGELLALQARLYQVSQHIEVMTKVVDQMAGGIKTVINTNV